jgi:hypothetical protein
MKKYWGSGGIIPHILNLALEECEWSASCPGRIIPPRLRALDTNWAECWVEIAVMLQMECEAVTVSQNKLQAVRMDTKLHPK